MLHCCVFLCGAALMIIELTGSRILAPFLGTSLVVWTSLIGIILASLSLGAWWGGILADRRPSARLLGRIVLLAAWATAAIGLSKSWVLPFLQGAGSLHVTAIVATLVLFAPASVLLGMVAPFAVRLQLADTEAAGRTAGSLYALSTIGSIAGTFLAGFVLIAWVGSTAILFITAAVLACAAWLAAPSSRGLPLLSVLLFALALLLGRQQDRDARAAPGRRGPAVQALDQHRVGLAAGFDHVLVRRGPVGGEAVHLFDQLRRDVAVQVHAGDDHAVRPDHRPQRVGQVGLRVVQSRDVHRAVQVEIEAVQRELRAHAVQQLRLQRVVVGPPHRAARDGLGLQRGSPDQVGPARPGPVG